MNFNRVILGGHLTRDVVLKKLSSGTHVAEFGLAVNEAWTSADGQKTERVCFVDCALFGKRAEVLAKFTGKGSPLLVEGTLRFDTWEKDDTRHSKHTVNVTDFEFVDRKPEGSAK